VPVRMDEIAGRDIEAEHRHGNIERGQMHKGMAWPYRTRKNLESFVDRPKIAH
jgi:hypothetical protein